MEELMDTLMNDDMSASDSSDKIKDILFAKSADKINDIKPDIASHLFGNPPEEVEDESETEEDPTSELEDGESPEEEEDFIKDRIRLDKRVATYKAESAYYKKLYERVIKDSTRSEILVDTIKRYVTPLKPTKQYPTRKPGSRKRGKASQVMVAPLTDTHVGDNV